MKVIKPDELKQFLKTRSKDYNILAPVKYLDGTRIFGSPDEGEIDFINGPVALKPTAPFFPQNDQLFEYKDNKMQKKPYGWTANSKPLFVLGYTAADAEALNFTDNFYSSNFKDNQYLEKRKNSIVAVVSGKLLSGFQKIAGKNCDLEFVYDGSKFFINTYTEAGKKIADGLGQEGNSVEYDVVNRFSVAKENENLRLIEHASRIIMKGLVPDEFWKETAEYCIACGSCVFYCPTCTCFDVYDVGSSKEGERIRCWDACLLGGYTREASGHNPRDEAERTRRRVTHKLESDPKNWNRLGCVACGRCDAFCPTGIGIFSVAKKIVERYAGKENIN